MKVEDKKIEIINNYLTEEYMLIHFDARVDGVSLPDHLMNNPTVSLKLSYNFMGGMEINSERIWAKLLFSGKMVDCYIPFQAIWGATSSSGANMIWPEFAPKEIMLQVIESLSAQPDSDTTKSQLQDKSESTSKTRPIKQSVTTLKPQPTKKKPRKTPTRTTPPGKGGHLKRIK